MKLFTASQIRAYLDRMDYRNGMEPTFEHLAAMHRQHLLYIPYENLDLMNGVPLDLNAGALFQKIILNKRGGYCFELQGLFYCLLKSLGYSISQYAGRFMDEPGDIQMRRHRILVVELDGKRLVCDVGVRSESPRCPLELAEQLVQTDGISEYRYQKDPFFGWVLSQRERGKNWKTLLGFTEEIQLDTDFVMPSFYCEKHPDSTFNKFMKVSIFNAESNLTIVGNTFKIYRGAKVMERKEIQTNEEAITILKNKFGIDVPHNYQNLLYLKEK